MTTEAMKAPCGLIPIGKFQTKPKVALKGVHVKVELVHLCSRTVLQQKYKNEGETNLEVKYVFPLDSSAAVCAFEAKIGQRTIKGKVEGKKEAKKTYDKAVKGGQMAALLEKDTENEDAFVCHIGNLLPGEECEIRITYVSEVDSEGKSIRCTIPTSLCNGHIPWKPPAKSETRSPPNLTQAEMNRMSEADLISYIQKQSVAQAKIDAQKRAEKAKQLSAGTSPSDALPCEVSVIADIQMPSEIIQCRSPSHPLKCAYNKKQRKIVKLEKKTRLTKEVVILVDQGNPYESRCVVEDYDEKEGSFQPPTVKESKMETEEPVGPTPSTSRVVQIAFNREYVDPDTDMFCELVFLVDKSGSMSGSRIAHTKATLEVFLNSLPTNCLFNIIAFSKRFNKLFEKSMPYNDDSMRRAQNFVSQLNAKGGTNIYDPLEDVLSRKPIKGYPRQIFLLTDGEVQNTSDIIRLAAQHAQTTRVFSFGIGQSASVALCKGLALKSRGMCEMVREADQITDQVMRVISSALQPPLCGMEVDWTDLPDSKGTMKQVPEYPPPVYPGQQFVYAMDVDTSSLKGGKIKVQSSNNNEEEEIVVDIPTVVRKGTLIHTLAARSRIRELENKAIISKKDKAEIKALGLKYNLASSMTSFVAVQTVGEDAKSHERKAAATAVPHIVPSRIGGEAFEGRDALVKHRSKTKKKGGRKGFASASSWSRQQAAPQQAAPASRHRMRGAAAPPQQMKRSSKSQGVFGGVSSAISSFSGMFSGAKKKHARRSSRGRAERSKDLSRGGGGGGGRRSIGRAVEEFCDAGPVMKADRFALSTEADEALEAKNEGVAVDELSCDDSDNGDLATEDQRRNMKFSFSANSSAPVSGGGPAPPAAIPAGAPAPKPPSSAMTLDDYNIVKESTIHLALRQNEKGRESEGKRSVEWSKIKPEEQYKMILKGQKADGSWELSGMLLGMAGCDSKKLQTALAQTSYKPSKDTERVLGTILAICLLRNKHAAKKGAYVILESKGRKFVGTRLGLSPKEVVGVVDEIWEKLQAK